MIEEHLQIISFNPRNLFSNLGLESYLSDLADAEYKIPEFDVPDSIENPDQPIQIHQLESDLIEQVKIDDLLSFIISENQGKVWSNVSSLQLNWLRSLRKIFTLLRRSGTDSTVIN